MDVLRDNELLHKDGAAFVAEGYVFGRLRAVQGNITKANAFDTFHLAADVFGGGGVGLVRLLRIGELADEALKKAVEDQDYKVLGIQ